MTQPPPLPKRPTGALPEAISPAQVPVQIPVQPQAQPRAFIEQFGNYKLIKQIGEGGMAEIFLAHDDNHGPFGVNVPPVVIKRLHQRLEKDDMAVDLFLTEADVTMMLDHPNVIRVFDAGEFSGRYYMCMEYVHGKDLEQIQDRLASKQMAMDPTVAVHIQLEILKGLAYIHDAKTASGRALGVVHRDVTPSNIWLAANGGIKVGDFGVAKLMGVEGWTMAGSLKGKLGYLSPEQVAGQPPSQSIDVWAAAVILYEMLAGARAFTGENELDVMLRIKAAKLPRVRKIRKEIPKPLEKILKRALHKKERKRFASAGEFAIEVDAYMQKYSQPISGEQLVQYLSKTLS